MNASTVQTSLPRSPKVSSLLVPSLRLTILGLLLLLLVTTARRRPRPAVLTLERA